MWFVVSRSDMCVKDDASEAVATTDQVATDCFKEHESCGTKCAAELEEEKVTCNARCVTEKTECVRMAYWTATEGLDLKNYIDRVLQSEVLLDSTTCKEKCNKDGLRGDDPGCEAYCEEAKNEVEKACTQKCASASTKCDEKCSGDTEAKNAADCKEACKEKDLCTKQCRGAGGTHKARLEARGGFASTIKSSYSEEKIAFVNPPCFPPESLMTKGVMKQCVKKDENDDFCYNMVGLFIPSYNIKRAEYKEDTWMGKHALEEVRASPAPPLTARQHAHPHLIGPTIFRLGYRAISPRTAKKNATHARRWAIGLPRIGRASKVTLPALASHTLTSKVLRRPRPCQQPRSPLSAAAAAAECRCRRVLSRRVSECRRARVAQALSEHSQFAPIPSPITAGSTQRMMLRC